MAQSKAFSLLFFFFFFFFFFFLKQYRGGPTVPLVSRCTLIPQRRCDSTHELARHHQAVMQECRLPAGEAGSRQVNAGQHLLRGWSISILPPAAVSQLSAVSHQRVQARPRSGALQPARRTKVMGTPVQ